MVVVSAVIIGDAILALDFIFLFCLVSTMIASNLFIVLGKTGAKFRNGKEFIESRTAFLWYLAGGMINAAFLFFLEVPTRDLMARYLPLLPIANISATWLFMFWFMKKPNYSIRKRWKWFLLPLILFLPLELVAVKIGFGG